MNLRYSTAMTLVLAGVVACGERARDMCDAEMLEPAVMRGEAATIGFDGNGISEAWAQDSQGGGGFLLAEVGQNRCVQLDETFASDGSRLTESHDFGAFCQRCEQRNSVGVHFSLFELPSNDTLLPDGPLQLRLALRDCRTLTSAKGTAGEQGTVSWIPLHEQPPERWAVLRVSLIALRGSWLAQVLEGPAAAARLDSMAQLLSSRLEPARVRVHIAATCVLDALAEEQLEWKERDHEPLQRVLEAAWQHCPRARPHAQDPLVPLVDVPCLRVQDDVLSTVRYPLGYTTHIPGGLSSEGRADATFVANTVCGLPRPGRDDLEEASFTAAAAHELGHFLGLYHSVEAEGVDDTLPDTGERNLMNPNPLLEGSRGLSGSQARIVRRHPSMRWPLSGYDMNSPAGFERSPSSP